jgi:hypothetical protein
MMLRLTSLLFLFLLNGSTAQDGFQCGVIEEAKELDVSGNYNTISAEATCTENIAFLVAPKTIHWHVYAIADGDTPRYSMFPEDILEPYVEDEVLKFAWTTGLQGVNVDDAVEAAVNLYIPLQNMENIEVGQIGGVVEIINETPSDNPLIISIKNSGVGHKLFVRSPASPVNFQGDGVGSEHHFELKSGSDIEIDGVDQKVWLKTTDDLEMKVRGINTQVYLDGDYTEIKMSGLDSKVFIVNSDAGCDHVTGQDASNDCTVTDENVTIPDLECLSSTTAINFKCVASGAVSRFSLVTASVATWMVWMAFL